MMWRDEIVANRPFRARSGNRRAQCYGLLLFSNRFDADGMLLRTEHRGTAELFGDGIARLTRLTGSLTLRESHKKNGRVAYVARVDSAGDRRQILEYFGPRPSGGGMPRAHYPPRMGALDGTTAGQAEARPAAGWPRQLADTHGSVAGEDSGLHGAAGADSGVVLAAGSRTPHLVGTPDPSGAQYGCASGSDRGAGAVSPAIGDTGPQGVAQTGQSGCGPWPFNEEMLSGQEGPAAFLSGAFLACGNMTDPYKDYRLEFVLHNPGLAAPLQELLLGFGVTPKQAYRRGLPVVYVKESSQVEDLLTIMGATKSCLALMEIEIEKDLRNKVNRVTNCETANISKTVNAAAQQLEEIRLIQSTVGLDALPRELAQLAELRLENPELSLRELGELLTPPISRSGVNHRLGRIRELGTQIRRKQGEQ